MKRTLLFLSLFAATTARAADPGMIFNPAEELGTGARPAALGSAFAGLEGGLDSLSWNPAGMLGLTVPEASFHHLSWIGGENQEALFFAVPSRPWGVFAAGVQGTFYGTQDERDDNGNVTGTLRPTRESVLAGWAKGLGHGFSFGLVLHNEQLLLGSEDFSKLSLNGGLLYKNGKGWALGASVAGAGTYVGTSPSGQVWRLGASAPLRILKGSPTLVLLGATYEPYGVRRLQCGLEHHLVERLCLRMGYQATLQNNQLSGFRGLSSGFGWNAGGWALDYAFLPEGELGSSHRVSLRVKLGSERMAITTTPTPTSTETPTPASIPTLEITPAATPTSVAYTAPVQATPTPGESLRLFFSLPEETPIPEGKTPKGWKKNLQSAQAAVDARPQDEQAWLALGRLYYQVGRTGEAVQCFEQVLRIKPDFPGLSEWLEKNRAQLEPTPDNGMK